MLENYVSDCKPFEGDQPTDNKPPDKARISVSTQDDSNPEVSAKLEFSVDPEVIANSEVSAYPEISQFNGNDSNFANVKDYCSKPAENSTPLSASFSDAPLKSFTFIENQFNAIENDAQGSIVVDEKPHKCNQCSYSARIKSKFCIYDFVQSKW